MENSQLPNSSGPSDPIVCYLIVRSSLKMGMGKCSAQVGHGVQMVMIAYYGMQIGIEQGYGPNECVNTFRLWLNTDYRKVVLGATDKEFEKLKELPEEHYVVKDLGLTEIAEGSETVIAFFPMKKSAAPKLIKRLQLLK